MRLWRRAGAPEVPIVHIACLLADPRQAACGRLESLARDAGVLVTRLRNDGFVRDDQVIDPQGVRALGLMYRALLWPGLPEGTRAALEDLAGVPVLVDSTHAEPAPQSLSRLQEVLRRR